jgi:hypothetical protein
VHGAEVNTNEHGQDVTCVVHNHMMALQCELNGDQTQVYGVNRAQTYFSSNNSYDIAFIHILKILLFPCFKYLHSDAGHFTFPTFFPVNNSAFS